MGEKQKKEQGVGGGSDPVRGGCLSLGVKENESGQFGHSIQSEGPLEMVSVQGETLNPCCHSLRKIVI